MAAVSGGLLAQDAASPPLDPRNPRLRSPPHSATLRPRSLSHGVLRTGTPPTSRAPSEVGSESSFRLARRSTASSLSSQTSGSSQISGRSGEAWGDDGRGRLRRQGGGETDSAAAAGALQWLLGPEHTVAALTALVAQHDMLALRMLLRLIREITPGAEPSADDALPPKALKALRAYGLESDDTSATSAREAAQKLCQGGKLHRFVRDAFRLCEGVDVPTGGGVFLDTDFNVFIETFDLRDAVLCIARQRQKEVRRTEAPSKRRLSADPSLGDEELSAAAKALLQMLEAQPGADGSLPLLPNLCAGLRRHQGLAEQVLLRVVVGLAPEGSRCSRLQSPQEALPAAALKMLKAYGIGNVANISEAADELVQGKSLERFVRDALRIAVGIDAAGRLELGSAMQFIAVFRLTSMLLRLPCASSCRACWGMMAGADAPALRSLDEIDRIVDTREAAAVGTWAQQTLAKGTRRAPDHLRELQELEEALGGAAAPPPSRSPAGQEAKRRPKDLTPLARSPGKPQEAPDPLACSSGDQEELHVDAEIVVLADVEQVKQLVAKTKKLGWVDEMTAYCGRRGRVKRYDDRDRRHGKVQVQHSDMVVWTWPIAACILAPTSLVLAGVAPGSPARVQPPAPGSISLTARTLGDPPPSSAAETPALDARPGSAGRLPPLKAPPRPPSGGAAPPHAPPPEPPQHHKQPEPLGADEAARLAELRAALPALRAPPPPPGGGQSPPPLAAAEAAPPPPMPPPPAPPSGGHEAPETPPMPPDTQQQHLQAEGNTMELLSPVQGLPPPPAPPPPQLNLRSCLKKKSKGAAHTDDFRVHRRPDSTATKLRPSLVKDQQQQQQQPGGVTEVLRHGEVVTLLYNDKDDRGRQWSWVRTLAGTEGWVRAAYIHDSKDAKALAVLSHPMSEVLAFDAQFRRLFSELDAAAQEAWRNNWSPDCKELIRHVHQSVKAGLFRGLLYGAADDSTDGGSRTGTVVTPAGSDISGGTRSTAKSRVSFCLSRAESRQSE